MWREEEVEEERRALHRGLWDIVEIAPVVWMWEVRLRAWRWGRRSIVTRSATMVCKFENGGGGRACKGTPY